jgi:hypothetical protein
MQTPQTAAVIREAIALAEELDVIRFAYGDGCLDHVKRTLNDPQSTRWEDAVTRAVAEWNETHAKVSDFA